MLKQRYEDYLLAILDKRIDGIHISVIRAIAYIMSKLYEAIVCLKVWCYNTGIIKQYMLGSFVVSVGNITPGGTGKTPVVEMIARILSEDGRKVAIVTRGYKGRLGEKDIPYVVTDGNDLFLDPVLAGDEAYMLAKRLDNVVVIIGRNRVKSAELGLEKYGCDTIILDDGYQYMRLARHINILVIDATNPFGNGYLLPRGVLREPLRNLNRANVFLLTKSDGAELDTLKGFLRKRNPDAIIAESIHKPVYLGDIYTQTRRDLRWIEGRRVVCVSGIASPEGFEQAIRNLGAVVIGTHRFPDHHIYSEEEIERIVDCAVTEGADAIVTTEKDAVRFPSVKKPKKLFICYLRIEIEITNGKPEFYSRIMEKL